ncbi:TlpA family protein disulfide reductase [Streptomyces platensis]|uniref:TlpA family protein disulfide reductase n=1 Tax=Streptomyces platensis TaxID=58346 RepID=UPI003C2D1764
MVYLALALAAVAALCALDLMLTLAVLRRLREERTNGSSHTPSDTQGGGIPKGALVGPFETRCVEGARLTDEDLVDGAVVGFFSPMCPPCKRELPAFVALATTLQGVRQVIAVVISVTGRPDEEAEAVAIVEQLAPLARVVREDDTGSCLTAFGVSAFPSHFEVSVAAGARPAVAAVGAEVLGGRPARSV